MTDIKGPTICTNIVENMGYCLRIKTKTEVQTCESYRYGALFENRDFRCRLIA